MLGDPAELRPGRKAAFMRMRKRKETGEKGLRVDGMKDQEVWFYYNRALDSIYHIISYLFYLAAHTLQGSTS